MRVADRSRLLGRGRVVALWAATLGLVLAAHGALGFAWLTRSLPALTGGQIAEPGFDLDLAEPAPAESADPMLEPAPNVPWPEMSAATEASAPPPETPPPEPVAPPIQADPPAPPSVAAAPAHPPVRVPPPAVQVRERARARERAEARREAAEDNRRRAASARQGREAGASRSAAPVARTAPAPGASAAASAAWRSQIVGILRGRFAGGRSGMASVTFLVARGGQIGGARLTASSGDPRLDAAALAVFRGAVPAPPAGYVGPLTFNIRLGVR